MPVISFAKYKYLVTFDDRSLLNIELGREGAVGNECPCRFLRVYLMLVDADEVVAREFVVV